MNMKEIDKAVAEAKRFIERVGDLKVSIKDRGIDSLYWFPAQTGAVRRASLDLTRQLAKMRRPI